MAQAQPLDIPTASQLTKARDFLCEAAILVTDVKSLLSDSENFATAARLKDIQGRLADEIQVVERALDRRHYAGPSPLNAAQQRAPRSPSLDAWGGHEGRGVTSPA